MQSVLTVDKILLEEKVKSMYRDVAWYPKKDYHFEMGRSLALKLGYSENELDNIPQQSVESFAGVGYHFKLAAIQRGDRVLDLGSGSGMDLFIAENKVGFEGSVTGVDMTVEQLEKSKVLAIQHLIHVSLVQSYIEQLPFFHPSFDVIISNGVINLSADKGKVFSEAARVLRKKGRLAISDIVTEKHLPGNISCNASLWAACIGGAMQKDDYFNLIEKSGFIIKEVKVNNQYSFLSKGATGASNTYRVKSISLLAEKI